MLAVLWLSSVSGLKTHLQILIISKTLKIIVPHINIAGIKDHPKLSFSQLNANMYLLLICSGR